jgi:ribosomal protein S12 methylthiotransferase
MELQQPIAWQKNQQEIGKIVDVLIEQENPETGKLIGRSGRFAPEIDGQVYVVGVHVGEASGREASGREAKLGTIVPVAIQDADTYDLYGQIVNN